jgi:predicted O-methyltransferase YrrM
MLTAERRACLAGLEGLISEEVGLTLARLASEVHLQRCIVEIGSYRGKSTAYLAAGALAGLEAPVFAVDPWDLPGNVTGRFGFAAEDTRRAFRRQLEEVGVEHHVTAFRGFSRDLAKHWQRPIGLLYIDGSHTEKDVRNDWLQWKRWLAPNAVVAFDDYRTPRNPGVAVVVDELRRSIRKAVWTEGPAPLIFGSLP